MEVADTTFLFAILHPGDKFHADATRESALVQDLLVPTEVFSELMGLVLKRSGLAGTLAAKEWLAQPKIRLGFTSDREHRLAWRLYEEQGGRLSFVDAIGVVWARLEGASLLSYDRHQREALEPK